MNTRIYEKKDMMNFNDDEREYMDFLSSIRNFFRYAKSRLFVTAYTFILTFLFVDIFNLMYWQFAIFFIPLNFIVNYFIFKRVFT